MIRQHVIFCECCNESFAELDRCPTDEDIYYCTSCREYAKEQGVAYPQNTFTKAVDYGSVS